MIVSQILRNKEERKRQPQTPSCKKNKEHKFEKLRRLAQEQLLVSFVVKTPSSEHSSIQAVVLRNANVTKSQQGNYLICGRDIEEEEKIQESNTVRRAFCSRPKHERVYRCYRVDRIINKTIH